MVAPYTQEQRSEGLAHLPDWQFDADRNALHRDLVFQDFPQALAFMVRVGIEAEKADHHPEWTNVYNCVRIWLTTHDAGGVSHRDFDLARTIDRILA